MSRTRGSTANVTCSRSRIRSKSRHSISVWIPHYLPHWSSREASAARYEVGGGLLRLDAKKEELLARM